MKKFTGNKGIKTIKKSIKKMGGHWDQSGYDQGEDWINITFPFEGIEHHVLYNASGSGKFITKDESLSKELISEADSQFDEVPWYAELLNTIYKSEEAA